MKKLFALSLLVSSTSVFAALPPFTPQNLEGFKGVQRDSMSRLRVNLTVSSNNDAGEISISISLYVQQLLVGKLRLIRMYLL
ncbi:hypothetical protein [Acinetobacter sp. YT-02]|uniref:hypothetical protein n=1 Tax=Acinetobacter sp. YT-02 TaxID=2018564 RepID=UPI001F5B1A7C|nr:hypothetical protein [Acinetobacter sp. YT-02]